jgi:hypothetical protein
MYLTVEAAMKRHHASRAKTRRLGGPDEVGKGLVSKADNLVRGVVEGPGREGAVEELGRDLRDKRPLLVADLFVAARHLFGLRPALRSLLCDVLVGQRLVALLLESVVLGLEADDLGEDGQHLLAGIFGRDTEGVDLERVVVDGRGPRVGEEVGEARHRYLM